MILWWRLFSNVYGIAIAALLITIVYSLVS